MVRRATVDTTEAQSFEAVEPGPYRMVVDEVGEDETSNAGNPGFWVYFRFEDPTIQRRAGRVRKWYSISGKGSGFFRELWKAATGQDIPMATQIDVDLDDLNERPVVINIGNKEYEGRLQNEVERVAAA